MTERAKKISKTLKGRRLSKKHRDNIAKAKRRCNFYTDLLKEYKHDEEALVWIKAHKEELENSEGIVSSSSIVTFTIRSVRYEENHTDKN